MTTFSASRTNHSVLEIQSRDSSRRLSRSSAHLGPPSDRCYRGYDSASVSWRHPTPFLATDLSIKHETFRNNYRQLHRSNRRNTLIHAHTISRNFPTSDTSLCSLTAALPEAGDIAEQLTPYPLFLSHSNETFNFLDILKKTVQQQTS